MIAINILGILTIYVIGVIYSLFKSLVRTISIGSDSGAIVKFFLIFYFIWRFIIEFSLLTILAIIYLKWTFVQLYSMPLEPKEALDEIGLLSYQELNVDVE